MNSALQQQWIDQLKDKKYANKVEAINELAEHGDGTVVQPLFESIPTEEGNGFWRVTEGGELTPASAENKTGSCAGVHEAVHQIDDLDAIIASLFGSNHDTRAEAAWSLGYYAEDEKARQKIRDLLVDKARRVQAGEVYDKRVLLNCLRTGRKMKILDERILVPLIRIEDRLVQWEVISGLGECEAIGDRTKGFLVSTMLDDENSNALRCLIAKLLASHPDERIAGPLIGLLRAENPDLRKHAAITLGKINAKSAVTPLFQQLIDDDEMVRYATGVGLAFLGDNRTIPFLLRAKRHGDQFIQAEATKAIDQLAGDALTDLIEAMREEPLPYRIDAAEILVALEDKRAVISLIEAMLDEELFTQARKGIMAMKDEAIDPLIYVVRSKDAPPYFKEKCLRVLADMNTDRVIDVFIEQLKSPTPSIRALCARMLGDYPVARAKEPLLEVIQRGDRELDEVIAEAALAIGKLKDPTVLSSLLHLLEHLNSKVRAFTIASLGELGVKEAVKPLIKRVQDPNQDNRPIMIQALAKLGDDRAVDPLFGILNESKYMNTSEQKGGYLGSYAIRALATLGESRILPIVLSEWEEELEAVLDLLGSNALPQLEWALLNEKSEHIRALAAEGLGFLVEGASMGPLINALQDKSERVRDAASWSLNQIYTYQQASAALQ